MLTKILLIYFEKSLANWITFELCNCFTQRVFWSMALIVSVVQTNYSNRCDRILTHRLEYQQKPMIGTEFLFSCGWSEYFVKIYFYPEVLYILNGKLKNSRQNIEKKKTVFILNERIYILQFPFDAVKFNHFIGTMFRC